MKGIDGTVVVDGTGGGGAEPPPPWTPSARLERRKDTRDSTPPSVAAVVNIRVVS